MSVLIFIEKTSSNILDVELKDNPFKRKYQPPGVIITHDHTYINELWKLLFPQCQPSKE